MIFYIEQIALFLTLEWALCIWILYIYIGSGSSLRRKPCFFTVAQTRCWGEGYSAAISNFTTRCQHSTHWTFKPMNDVLPWVLFFIVSGVLLTHSYFLPHICNSQILDDRNIQHRYRCSTYRTTTSIAPSICTMPLKLDENWNQIQFNLSDFTVKTYGTNYAETQRVQVSAETEERAVFRCYFHWWACKIFLLNIYDCIIFLLLMFKVFFLSDPCKLSR